MNAQQFQLVLYLVDPFVKGERFGAGGDEIARQSTLDDRGKQRRDVADVYDVGLERARSREDRGAIALNDSDKRGEQPLPAGAADDAGDYRGGRIGQETHACLCLQLRPRVESVRLHRARTAVQRLARLVIEHARGNVDEVRGRPRIVLGEEPGGDHVVAMKIGASPDHGQILRHILDRGRMDDGIHRRQSPRERGIGQVPDCVARCPTIGRHDPVTVGAELPGALTPEKPIRAGHEDAFPIVHGRAQRAVRWSQVTHTIFAPYYKAKSSGQMA
jgi:hypothetical protein